MSRFITLEGIDGAGKSTHVAWLAARLEARGRQGDYTMAEAKEAFERMRKKHKW